MPCRVMSENAYRPISRSSRTCASSRCRASWSKCAWVDAPMSVAVTGKSWKYQSQRREGWFRHGSIITLTPFGEVMRNAELP